MTLSDIIAILDEAFEYFDSLADVTDGDYGAPKANKEMTLATRTGEASFELSRILKNLQKEIK